MNDYIRSKAFIHTFFLHLIFSYTTVNAQVFAVIGDYGMPGQPELNVSNLVKSWQPEFIITTGDNNYFYGDSLTIDTSIGYYYHEYIFPYKGIYGGNDTTTINRFFPALGNHDLLTANGLPYYNYFTLPNNERYYDVVFGNVHLFALNSDPVDGHEPDGTSGNSFQAGWLMGKLTSSTSPWNIVYFHHSAFSSCTSHGSSAWMQWPFAQWGATAVIGGHDHVYERLLVANTPYFVNGLGGMQTIYNFNIPLPESAARYNGTHGAMRISAFPDSICFEFRNINDSLIDSYCIYKTVGITNPEYPSENISCAVIPNPFAVSATLYINKELKNAVISIYDVVGREVEKIECITGKEIELFKNNLTPGVFFLKVLENNNLLAIKKIIISE